MVFVQIAINKDKFNKIEDFQKDNKIKLSEDSEPKIEGSYYINEIHNNDNKPLNFNVNIGHEDNGFELGDDSSRLSY